MRTINNAPIAPVAQPALTFRKAETADVEAIVNLVNSAYRGESSKAGWTTEADLLGGQRTDREEIQAILADANSVILLCHADAELIASMHLEKNGQEAHFSMFAVKPGLQNSGIGKRCMDEAERFVHQQWHCQRSLMSVIILRQSLIEYYERRGYQQTGKLKPFPQSEKFGIPKVSGLQLEVLEKALGHRD